MCCVAPDAPPVNVPMLLLLLNARSKANFWEADEEMLAGVALASAAASVESPGGFGGDAQ